ncbi:MAG: glycerol-3-phosphate responsive antiterminator [Clostridia bacterium]|nr:glycerol-3-phosphate responsive antiterminator [Clostridia bacterium]
MTNSTTSTVIAATRSREEFETALRSEVSIIFDLNPDILTLCEVTKMAHAAKKKLFIHLDLAQGIGKDKCGIAYAKGLGVDGIISTRVNIIRAAKELGLFTVQRFFIVDSHSVDTSLEALRASRADMIEVMPGIAYKAIAKLCTLTSVPIIAGGLIEQKSEITQAMTHGAAAISTGMQALWRG